MSSDSQNPPLNKDDALSPLPVEETESWGELFKTAFMAFFLAVVIRTFFYEPFNIPSQSMLPTLLVGDYLFVSKQPYGYSRYSFPFGLPPFEGRVGVSTLPQRGDVVVFKTPEDNKTDFIKRIIGLPGDTIQVEDGRLYINGTRVEREPVGLRDETSEMGAKMRLMEYIETLPNGAMHRIYEVSDEESLDDTEVFKVPSGHYFMMGDNRDNSRDSRVPDAVGFVPFQNIVGRADRIFFSTDGSAALYEPWKWPFAIRYARLFTPVGPPTPAPKTP